MTMNQLIVIKRYFVELETGLISLWMLCKLALLLECLVAETYKPDLLESLLVRLAQKSVT
jgi:hypothetical protein